MKNNIKYKTQQNKLYNKKKRSDKLFVEGYDVWCQDKFSKEQLEARIM